MSFLGAPAVSRFRVLPLSLGAFLACAERAFTGQRCL